MHFINALAWEIGTAPIWIAGIAADGDARLALWAVATLIAYGGVIAGHPLPGRKSPFSSDSQIHRAEEIGLSAAAGAPDASRIVGLGNYTLIVMVIGIIAIAVGDELAIAHPGGPNTLDTAVLVFGGPALFLLVQAGFMRRATGRMPPARVIACIALAALALVTTPLSLLAAVTAASAVLVAVAISDTRVEADLSGPR